MYKKTTFQQSLLNNETQIEVVDGTITGKMEGWKNQDHQNKFDSVTTIFSLTTTMVGSGLLVFPILFDQFGVVTSVMMIVAISYISYTTSSLMLLHTRINDTDFIEVIQRTLGSVFYRMYVLSSGITLFMIGVIYYLLMTNIQYSVFNYFSINVFQHQLPSKSTTTLSTFSFQYNNLITSLTLYLLISKVDLQLIMKLGKYSFSGIVLLMVFITFAAFDNIYSNKPNYQQLNLYSTDLSKLSGNIGTSFMIQNVLVPILQSNKHPQNNQKYLQISFAIAVASYSYMGLVGYLAILSKQSTNNSKNTVMDFFPSSQSATLLINLFIFYKQITISPLIAYHARKQILLFIYSDPSVNISKYNAIFISFCLMLGYNNICTFISQSVAPIIVLAITGTICGFYCIYLLPILVHLHCIHIRSCPTQNSNPSQCQACCPSKKVKIIQTVGHLLIIVFGVYQCQITLSSIFS